MVNVVPLKLSLSREVILEVGLRIAREHDLGQLSIRLLASELGVTPMAMYRYFENKAEIIDGVIDRFVAEAAVTDHIEFRSREPADDWRLWIQLTFGRMHGALCETPGVIPLLGSSYLGGPGGNLQFIGDNAEAYGEAFETKNKAAKRNVAQLVDFIKQINQTNQAYTT